MKEFTLIFRLNDIKDFKPSPEQMQERMNWLARIAAEDRLVDKGNTLLPFPANARTVKPGELVVDGPYTEASGLVTGYMTLKAESIEEAVQIAKGNPIFKLGGTIEVRETLKRD